MRCTLATILDQTRVPDEIIVVDDASDVPVPTDGTAFGDSRVRVLRTPHRCGVSRARGYGLAEATGAWVGFCDDDDLWLPDKLERQLRAVQADGARWCVCDAAIVEGDIVEGDWRLVEVRRCPIATLDEALRQGNPVPGGGSGVLAERALLREAGGFDPDFAMFADWELWLRLHRLAVPVGTGAVGLLYRRHAGQMSADPARATAELARLLARHPATFGEARRLPRMDRWMLGEMRRAGRYADALRHASRMQHGRSAEWLATLAHPLVRAVRPFLLPAVDRVRGRLGGSVGDAEGRAAVDWAKGRFGGGHGRGQGGDRSGGKASG